jgi:hypothetical protein
MYIVSCDLRVMLRNAFAAHCAELVFIQRVAFFCSCASCASCCLLFRSLLFTTKLLNYTEKDTTTLFQCHPTTLRKIHNNFFYRFFTKTNRSQYPRFIMTTTTTSQQKGTTSFPKGPERQHHVLRLLLRDIDAPFDESEIAELPRGVQHRLRNHRTKRASKPAFAEKFAARAHTKLSEPKAHCGSQPDHSHAPHARRANPRPARGPRQTRQEALRVLLRDVECGLHDEEFAKLPSCLQLRVHKHRELRARKPDFTAAFVARAQRQLHQQESTTSTVLNAADHPSAAQTLVAPTHSVCEVRRLLVLRTLLRDVHVPLSEEEITQLAPGLQKRLRKVREKRAHNPKFADQFIARTTAKLERAQTPSGAVTASAVQATASTIEGAPVRHVHHGRHHGHHHRGLAHVRVIHARPRGALGHRVRGTRVQPHQQRFQRQFKCAAPVHRPLTPTVCHKCGCTANSPTA